MMNFQEMTDDQLWDYLETLKDSEGITHDFTGQGHLAHEELISRPNSFRIRFDHSDQDIDQALATIENQMKDDHFVA